MTAKTVKGKLFNHDEVVVTVELPTSICRTMAEAASALRHVDGVPEDVVWIPPLVSHVSLLYSARVREDLLRVMVDVWRPLTAATPPFVMKASGLTFCKEGEGEEEKITAIWVAFEPSEEFDGLRSRLLEALEALEVPVAPEIFPPHIPLALADDFKPDETFLAAFQEWQDKTFGEVPVGSLSVKVANPVEGDVTIPFSVTSSLPLGGKEE